MPARSWRIRLRRAAMVATIGLVSPVCVVAAAPATAAPASAAPCEPVDRYAHRVVSAADAAASNDAGDEFGGAVATGDFNGDGFSDVAVGAPQDSVNGVRAGAVFVFAGSASGVGGGARLTQSDTSEANESGDRFGAALAAADVNRDGFADLVIGSPGEAIGTKIGAGALIVFFGSAAGLTTGLLRDQSHAGGSPEPGDAFGAALAVGDVNNDTYPDVVIGSPGEAPGTFPAGGVVFILRGSRSGLVSGGFKTQEQAGGTTVNGDRFGQAVAVGDVTGDGVADVVVGAPNDAPGGKPAGGAIYVLPGPGLTGGYGRTQENAGGASETGDGFGSALAVADFNGDAVADIAVGAPQEAPSNDPAGGVFFVFRGARASAPTGYFLTQAAGGVTTEAGDGFGAALTAGDVDADGFADLAVGVPTDRLGAEPRGGAVLLFGGGPRYLERGRRIGQAELGVSNEAGDRFGSALAAGDVTGDGRADIAIGVPGEALPGEPAGGVVNLVAGLSGAVSIGGLVGAVSDTSVRIWGRGARPGQLRVQYRAAGAPMWTSTAGVAFDPARDHTAVVVVAGLVTATRYEYRLAVDCVVDPLSTGAFRTLPALASTGRVRIGYGADLLRAQYSGFSNVAATNPEPDLMILGGDQIYAEPAPTATTTAQFYAKYRAVWGDAYVRRFTAGVPTLMMWDDHEIADDWSAGQTGVYLQARPAYEAYQGNHNPPPRVAGNLYYTTRAGPADIYILDTRSHRSAKSAADSAAKTMLGATQKADLKGWLSTSTARFKFIVSSVPWSDFGTTGNDSWKGFSTERAELFRYIRDNRIRGVVLISGDQHWAGAFRLSGYAPVALYEFMPTPLMAFFRPPPTGDDPQILFKTGNRNVFATFDVDASPTTGPARLTVEYRDTDTSALLYQLTITENDTLPS
jgi:phosphodiesterase/alkaline phosphatase D-like protein